MSKQRKHYSVQFKFQLALEAAQGRRTREAVFTTYLCEALLLARQAGEAFTLAERALVLSRERFERATEARGLYLRGEIAAQGARGDGPAAEHDYHDALALAGELGMRPLAAQCHLGLARLSRRSGERHAREQHLATASAMFRELGMSFWGEQVEAEARAG